MERTDAIPVRNHGTCELNEVLVESERGVPPQTGIPLLATAQKADGMTRSLGRMISGVAILALGAAVLGTIFFNHESAYVHEAAHAAVEALGTLAAVVLWGILLLQHPLEQLDRVRLWLALGLLAMGLFDGFHAFVDFRSSPDAFVGLHSFAVIAGGLLFSLVWLPARVYPRVSAWSLSLAIGASVFAIAFATLLVPRFLQYFIIGGEFAPSAVLLNMIGGVGFLAAALYFFARHWHVRRTEAFMFGCVCLLFGLAGVLFYRSHPWDLVWWGWHLLRLTAYCVVLAYSALAVRAQTRAAWESAERTSAILDSAADGIVGLDSQGRTVLVNQAAVRLTGFSALEMMGRDHHALVHHSQADGSPYPPENCPVHQTLADGNSRQSSEDVFWRHDHTSYPVEYRVTPVAGNDAPRGVVLWFRDITKRKQAESALVRKNRELIEALEKRKAAEAQAIQAERSSMNYAQRLKAMSRRIVEVQESEQRRLGRDLHDSASSNLAVIGLELRAIEKQLPETSLAKVGAQLSDCLELVKASMEIVHNISSGLHSPVLDRLGLLPALEDFADRFAERTKIAVVVTGHSERRLPADKEIALFRIAQEALTNCAKHSNARNVLIKLAFNGDCITLSIEDDGRGFELLTVTQGAKGQGLGLLSMRERVEAIGGEFHIASALGKGTRVVVHTPYSKAVDSSDYVI